MQMAQMTGLIEPASPRLPRTNLFVMATIYAGTGSAPVRVRNLSPSGALIEGTVIPHPGTYVRLSRGSLSVGAHIVWHKEGHAGLRFESAVSVIDWLPQGRAITVQQRIDEVVQQAKAASNEVHSRSSDSFGSQASKLSAVELRRLRLEIQSLAEELAADPAAVERHGSKLQTLDTAAQALGRLASERWL